MAKASINYTIQELDGSQSTFIHYPKFLDNHKEYLKILNEITEWKTGDYKNVNLDRVQRYYNIHNRPFCDGIWKVHHPRWQPCPYEPWLMSLQNSIQQYTGSTLTSALINKYQTGHCHIPPHKDTTQDEYPSIVSLSFGETRTFRLTRVYYDPILAPHSLEPSETESHLSRDIELSSGDLLIMAGSSQKYFTHEILKGPETLGPRYNITFR